MDSASYILESDVLGKRISEAQRSKITKKEDLLKLEEPLILVLLISATKVNCEPFGPFRHV